MVGRPGPKLDFLHLDADAQEDDTGDVGHDRGNQHRRAEHAKPGNAPAAYFGKGNRTPPRNEHRFGRVAAHFLSYQDFGGEYVKCGPYSAQSEFQH